MEFITDNVLSKIANEAPNRMSTIYVTEKSAFEYISSVKRGFPLIPVHDYFSMQLMCRMRFL